MVSLAQLWLPIAASAIGVFIASSLIHMVFKWHQSDYMKLSNEDEVRAALRKSSPAPGQYVMPHCMDMKQMQSPEMQQKYIEGPIAHVLVRPNGPPKMGATLGQWFGMCAVVSSIAAYLAGATVPAGASFLAVCRVVGAATFLAYGGGAGINAIWMGHTWRSSIKDLFDAAIYATVAAVIFALLWPHA
jgi:hypothetical protein